MTTFAELKTQAASLLSDPSLKTFSSAGLGYYINAGIAEVSRFAPQRFIEDVDLYDGSLSYVLRGGNGNLIANYSFEEGDETMFDGAYNTVYVGQEELTGGWSVNDTLRALWSRSTNAKTGQHVAVIYLPAGTTSRYFYQDIPVNPDTTYYVGGWHWKGTAGGRGNVLSFHTLDSSNVVVTADAVRHDTTAATPQPMSGSIAIPPDGTVAFIRVNLIAYSAGDHTVQESYAFEDIYVTETTDNALVAGNSLDTIEVRRVEVWSTAYEPPQRVSMLSRGHGNSEAGWDFWDGRLAIPARVMRSLNTSNHYLKVWGYAPYDKLTYETQVTDLSFELEQAIMAYVKMEGLSQLSFERDLFTQWQTRSGNTDVSPAALMNALSMAREDWRRKARSILVLREGS